MPPHRGTPRHPLRLTTSPLAAAAPPGSSQYAFQLPWRQQSKSLELRPAISQGVDEEGLTKEVGRFALVAYEVWRGASGSPLTATIISGTCLVFIAQLCLPWLTAAWWKDHSLMGQRQHFYRYLTAMLVHRDTDHLWNNMWSLWGLGVVVEQTIGPLAYPLLYIVSGVAGGLLSYCYGTYRFSLGASGGVSGVLGSLAVTKTRLTVAKTPPAAWENELK